MKSGSGIRLPHTRAGRVVVSWLLDPRIACGEKAVPRAVIGYEVLVASAL